MLLSLVGTLGECAVAAEELRGWNVARAIGVIPAAPGIDPRWIAICLRSAPVQALMRAWATTTVQATLNLRDVRRLPILLPPEQLRADITETVSSLDDKIEQNRLTARALERLARAVFRAWFVDFEPVKAKVDGATNFPSMPQHVFDALPTRFVDSHIGPVPEAWTVGVLGDVFELGLGGQWGGEIESAAESYPARCLRGIDCHELANGSRPDVPLRWLKPTLAAKRRLDDGVVLVEGSGSYCGRSLLWRESLQSLYTEHVLYSNFTKRLNPRRGVPNAVVAWYQMKAAYDNGVIANHRTGSAFPNLDVKGMLNSHAVAIPDMVTAAAFSDFVASTTGPHWIAENSKLGEIRDYLLPKLLSREVRAEAMHD
ncbi:MAG TPA: hypothetical protein VMM79_11325 [Longimicrobiales bacterium]|nr:hypothetical protein [Longimicrobiales bacterium]